MNWGGGRKMRSRASLNWVLAGVLTFVFVVAADIQGQETKKIYTLQESVREALDRNWDLRARKERVQQAKAVKKQARAEFLPKFSTTYGYRRLSEPSQFRSTVGGPEIIVGTEDNFEWRGTITQPVFKGFALISNFELAKLGIDRSVMDVELSKLDLALETKEAYYDILIADRRVEVAVQDIVSRKSNLNVVRSFYEVGMVPINDLLRAEVELANSEQALVELKNEAKLARSAFNRVLARPVNEPVAVEDILEFVPVRGEFEEYVEKALANRPEIKLIDIAIRATDQEKRLAQSQFYPEVNIRYDYIKEGDTPDVSGSEFADTRRWEATAALSWTFWEWGKTIYTVKEQESIKKELIDNREALEDRISLEVREVLLALDATEKNIPQTRKAIEQGEENLRVNEERYKAQVTTIVEVQDAQRLLTEARVNYYRAVYLHKLARARLERVLGMI
jgi:outer membrane protein TolC